MFKLRHHLQFIAIYYFKSEPDNKGFKNYIQRIKKNFLGLYWKNKLSQYYNINAFFTKKQNFTL